MKHVDGKALIAGADSGIGRTIAFLFAQGCGDVAMTYKTGAQGTAETARSVEWACDQTPITGIGICLIQAIDMKKPAHRCVGQ